MGRKDSEKTKKKLDSGGFQESRMVTVSDDWCPCYPENQVEMIICARRGFGHKDTYHTRISVWGADDTGVELEYEAYGDHTAAYAIYEHWKKYIFDRVPDNVDMEWFFERGFYPA